MKIRLLYFAVIKDLVGKNQEDMELEGSATVRQLLVHFAGQYPQTEEVLPACRVAVNQDFVSLDHPLSENDEVVFIPPVAGGETLELANNLWVQSEALTLDPVLKALSQPQNGAQVLMIGTVRNQNEGQSVQDLKYEAYVPMVEKVFQEIMENTRSKYPQVQLAISHRVAHLEIGERAVIVGASAPHREEAFAACRSVIEALKKDAPIWKYETRENGQTWIGLGP